MIASILPAMMRMSFSTVGTKLLSTTSHRLAIAFSTMPGPAQWALAGFLLLLFALIACPIGLNSGFLRVEVIRSGWTLGSLALVTLVSPAVMEETIYRVALLPHSSERRPAASVACWVGFSLLLFVAFHLINLSGRGSARAKTCRHPVFLGLTAVLGVVCTVAYLESGSIWPAVLIHWVIVITWLGFLGGYRRLFSPASTSDQPV